MKWSDFHDRSRDEFQAHCQARCLAVSVGEGSVLCRVLGGLPMYVDAADRGVASRLIVDGFWEAWVTLAIARLVRPGWRCVDVGANHGYFTMVLADLVGPQGVVQAFEPNRRLFGLLKENVAVNGFQGRVVARHAACGSRAGRALLSFDQKDSGRGTILPTEEAGLRRVEVDLAALDDAVDGPVHLVKIDAEGSGREVWRGGGRLRRRNPDAVFLFEYSGGDDYLQEVEAEGYALSHIDFDGRIQPLPAGAVCADPARVWNLVARRSP